MRNSIAENQPVKNYFQKKCKNPDEVFGGIRFTYIEGGIISISIATLALSFD